MKSIQVDGLTYCFNISKNDKIPDCFCKVDSLFLQRNVAASSAQVSAV